MGRALDDDAMLWMDWFHVRPSGPYTVYLECVCGWTMEFDRTHTLGDVAETAAQHIVRNHPHAARSVRHE